MKQGLDVGIVNANQIENPNPVAAPVQPAAADSEMAGMEARLAALQR